VNNKPLGSESGSVIQDYGSADPDLKEYLRIQNTGKIYFFRKLYNLYAFCRRVPSIIISRSRV
jgi:hypothetical protein